MWQISVEMWLAAPLRNAPRPGLSRDRAFLFNKFTETLCVRGPFNALKEEAQSLSNNSAHRIV